MNTKHHKAVLDLFNDGEGEFEERVNHVLVRHSLSVDELTTAYDEVFSENDVEGAVIGIAAVDLAYPDHDADEYFEARSRVLNKCCPLLRLQREVNFPSELEHRAEEMMEIVFDGAERLQAGFPLAI
jgi:hypothetical protein